MASGSSLIKGIFVLLFIGAVFMGLTFLLDKDPEQTPIASTPTGSDVSAHANDPAVIEARRIGTDLGARIGEEIGRRVGEKLVASLDIPTEDEPDSSEASTLTADASDNMSDEPSVEEETVSEAPAPETAAEPEPAVEPEVVAAAEPEPEPAMESEPVVIAEEDVYSDEESISEDAIAEDSTDSEVTESEEQTTQTPTLESEPDPSKKFVFASSGWWNQSAGANGFSVKHVGQAVTATGINSSIVVILSAPFNGSQMLEELITVNDSSGSPVGGNWRRSANSRNLFLKVVEPGTYQVNISSQLTSREGISLGENLSGPITIK